MLRSLATLSWLLPPPLEMSNVPSAIVGLLPRLLQALFFPSLTRLRYIVNTGPSVYVHATAKLAIFEIAMQ